MSDSDLDMVRLAAAPYRTEDARERKIFDRYGNVTLFYTRVNHLIDQPEVMTVLPVQCRLLRERRAHFQRSRSA